MENRKGVVMLKGNYKDKTGRFIKDGDTLLFSIPDECEENGLCEFERLVRKNQGRLGFYSPVENRVIPFVENYDNNVVHDAIIKPAEL